MQLFVHEANVTNEKHSSTFRSSDLDHDTPRKFSTVLADFTIAGTNLQATLTREALRWKGFKG